MTDRTVLLYNISDQVEVKDCLSKILSSTNRGYSYSSSKNGNLALLTFVDKNDVSKFAIEEEHSVFMSKMCDEVFCNIEAYLSPESGCAIERLTVEQLEQLHANLTLRKDDNNIIMTDSLVKLDNFTTTFLKLLSHGAETFRLNEAAGKEECEIKEICSGTEPVQRESYVYTIGEFSGGKMDNDNLNVFMKVSAEVAPWVYSFIYDTDDEWNQIQEQAAVTVRQNDGKHTIHGSSLNCLQNAQHILFSLIGKVEQSVLNQKSQIQDYEVSSDEDIYRAAECNTGNYGTHPKSTKVEEEASSLASRNINSSSKHFAADCDHKVQNTHEANEEVETGDNNALNALENRTTYTIQSDAEALSPTWIVEDPVSQSTRSHGENVTEDQQEVKMQQNNITSKQMTNLSDHVTDCNDNGASTHGLDDHDGKDGDEFESFIVIDEPGTGSFIHIENQAANLQENWSAVINDSNLNRKETPPPTITRTEETRGQDTEKAIPTKEDSSRGDIHGKLRAEQNKNTVTTNLADEESAMEDINKSSVLTTSVEVDSNCSTKIVPMTSPEYNEEEYRTTGELRAEQNKNTVTTNLADEESAMEDINKSSVLTTSVEVDSNCSTKIVPMTSPEYNEEEYRTTSDVTKTNGDDSELTKTDGDDTELTKTDRDDTEVTETDADDIEISKIDGDDSELTRNYGDDSELTKTNGDDTKLTKTDGDDTELFKTDGDDSELTKTDGDDSELTKADGDDSELTKTDGDDTELTKTNRDDTEVTETDETIWNLPRLMETMVTFPRLTETIVNLPRLMETIVNLPRLMETIPNLPRLMETIWNLPRLMETIVNLPRLMETIPNLPRLMETIVNLPRLMETIPNLPRLMETIWNLPRLMETMVTLPRLIETIQNLPRLVETIWNLPRLMETMVTLPRLIETIQNLPRLVETIWNLPRLMETMVTLPRLIETIQSLPRLVETIWN
ncbi:otolith matrix protein OMM-64-like isoform X2 [Ptychodera flava]